MITSVQIFKQFIGSVNYASQKISALLIKLLTKTQVDTGNSKKERKTKQPKVIGT